MEALFIFDNDFKLPRSGNLSLAVSFKARVKLPDVAAVALATIDYRNRCGNQSSLT
jgi:hypothetical protein